MDAGAGPCPIRRRRPDQWIPWEERDLRTCPRRFLPSICRSIGARLSGDARRREVGQVRGKRDGRQISSTLSTLIKAKTNRGLTIAFGLNLISAPSASRDKGASLRIVSFGV